MKAKQWYYFIALYGPEHSVHVDDYFCLDKSAKDEDVRRHIRELMNGVCGYEHAYLYKWWKVKCPPQCWLKQQKLRLKREIKIRQDTFDYYNSLPNIKAPFQKEEPDEELAEALKEIEKSTLLELLHSEELYFTYDDIRRWSSYKYKPAKNIRQKVLNAIKIAEKYSTED